ncbi:MAG: cell division protein FtsZ [Rhodospirillaceae bacterium]|nr:cell division protein FtsZ [Rhodospirillaceae bacterium]
MTLKLSMPKTPPELRPRIVVFGVGGAGCNAVNNMLTSDIEGVVCVVANTDAQSLAQSECERQIQLGLSITQGLGAGSRPEIGRASAEEEIDQIVEHLNGSHMVFITAGMGGGTGTGAAPVIARTAREHGILTVGVVTKPFHFEGAQRMRLAESGLQELQDVVDTLIVIPNQNLFRVANEQTTFADAFRMADDVLHSGVRGITDLMVMPGLINLDFADIRSVMSEMGKAMMGAGEAQGDNRSIEAAESAISNPLLDDVSMKGARGLLINISGGPDLTLYEVDEAANRVRDEVDPAASIIFGSTFDPALEGKIRVSVFATGIDSPVEVSQRPTELRVLRPATHEAEPEAAEAPVSGDAAAAAVSTFETADAAAVRDMQAQAEISDPATGADTGKAEPQSEMFADAGAAGHAEAVETGGAGGIGRVETLPVEAAWAEAAAVETVQEATAHAESPPAGAAPVDVAPVETAPVERPTDLAQKVEEMLTPARPATVEETPDTRPDLRSVLWPEGRPANEPASSEAGAGTGRRESMFSFLRSRRKDSAKAADRASNSGRGNDDGDLSPGNPPGDAQSESTVRLITDSDRSRREAADRTGRAQTPGSGSDRKEEPSAEDDLLEIPAFLRRQAN